MPTSGLLLLLLTLLAMPQAAPQGVRTGIVGGNVFDAASGQPLKDATVMLSFVGPRPEREMKTDEKGFFAYTNVEPGEYELKVDLPRYLTQKYGQIAFDSRIGRNLVVEPGGRYNVSFPMIRAAVVSGRVYDSNRQPVAKAETQLLTSRYNNLGLRTLYRLIRPVNTDDRGEYRFEDVPPGDYYVRAAYGSAPATQAPGTLVVRANNVATIYYPGVTSSDEAQVIRVPAGTDVQAIDFSLTPPSPFKVSGRIVNPFLQQRLPAYDYYLVPRNARLSEGEGSVPDQDPANDKFEFRNVPPGSYDLYVGFHLGDPRALQPIYSGRIPIEVVDRDVTDLTVVIDSGINIKGEIKLDVDAATAKPNVTQVQPLFVVMDGMPAILSPTALLGRGRIVQQDGRFEIPHAAAGRYRLLVSLEGAMRSFYVSAARLGTQDILGQVFDIDRDSTGPLVVELSATGGTMAGGVTGRSGAAVAGAQVVLVPPINLRLDQTAYKTAITNEQGRFTISAIRPARYSVFAFPQRTDIGALMNAEFIAPYLNFGVSVEISKGQTIRQDFAVDRD